jgi:hypothetical protein
LSAKIAELEAENAVWRKLSNFAPFLKQLAELAESVKDGEPLISKLCIFELENSHTIDVWAGMGSNPISCLIESQAKIAELETILIEINNWKINGEYHKYSVDTAIRDLKEFVDNQPNEPIRTALNVILWNYRQADESQRLLSETLKEKTSALKLVEYITNELEWNPKDFPKVTDDGMWKITLNEQGKPIFAESQTVSGGIK